ncbi:MCE family protein [Amycolatopsis suaedae]|uniref:MCE family protein n=1 Tax=Amycolatopsis suaedae TaxID=2510978 RepID=A0A4Q7JC39_9PSEU|nr:MCE family protein [Amycolatopsis suaedae]RZQ63854.1 MCE family protein [Amycolatopsis suaedae]
MKRLLAAAVIAVLLAAGGLWYFTRDDAVRTVTADFAQADGVFPGNRVTVLGVEVGTVTATEPRGGTVRVTMAVPGDLRLPAEVGAWVITPSVISEKYVELDPPYRGGPAAEGDLAIPLERTRAPLAFDELMRSLNTLLTALGPPAPGQPSPLGQLVGQGARALDGNGARFRDAVGKIARASEVVAGHGDDITAALSSLDTLVRTLAANKSTVDSVTGAVTEAARLFGEQRGQLAGSLTQLAETLRQVNGLVEAHGAPLAEDLGRLAALSSTVGAHQRQLAEILDVAPLAFDNFGRAITPDGRLRIRLNISTNLSQIPAARDLCARFPIPLCSGAGLVNPIPFPPAAIDGLGIGSVLGGGR